MGGAERSEAITMSRRAWPSPIGDETKTARRRRCRPRAHRAGRARVAASLSTQSRIRRLTRTGSRAGGMWPAPSRTTSSPAVSRVTDCARVSGLMRSSPWITSIGTDTRSAHPNAASGSRTDCASATSTSRVVSAAQPTQSNHGRSLRRLRLCAVTAAGAYRLARFENNGTGVGSAIVYAYDLLIRTAHGNRKFPKRGRTFPPAEAGGSL